MKFKQYLKLQNEFRSKTPSNIVFCDDQKEFFSVDKEFDTGVFNGGINHEEPNFGCRQENRSALGRADMKDQTFQADLKKIQQPISHNISQVDEVSQKQRNMSNNRKQSLNKRSSHQRVTSGYNSNTISQSQSASNLHSASQSIDRSFQPTLSKENKKLERVNRKLKKHQDQYRQLYLEFYDEKQFQGNDEILQEFVHDNIQVEQPPEPLGFSGQLSQMEEETVYDRQNNSCFVESVKLKVKARNTSMISNQTTQGCATSQTLATRRSMDKHSNSIKNNFSNNVRNSGEFDIKSRLSKSKKVDLKSQRSLSKSALSSRSNGSAFIFKKINGMRGKKQINQEAKNTNKNPSDKMTELQREYQQIRENRKSIIDGLNLQKQTEKLSSNCSTPYKKISPSPVINKAKKSPSIFLRDISPKLQSREFQPVMRHKESNPPTRNTKSSSSLHKKWV